MVDLVTKAMQEAYFLDREPAMFFTGMFTLRPRGLHNSEKVTIDIKRYEENVAIAIQDLSAGYRLNSADLFTNKEFKPPVFKEAAPLNAHELLKRVPGQNPFQNPNFRMAALEQTFEIMGALESKVKRAMELMSSQVLQTGTVTLTDDAGNSVYSINFAPKATHFPTAGTSWSSATLAQKLSDIESLADLVRQDGLKDPNQLILGSAAWENLLQTSGFLERLDNRRADLGRITPPESVGMGGTYRGKVVIGAYEYDVFTYTGHYKDPQTGVSTKYMDPGKIIVKASDARLDATFGGIPNFNEIFEGAGTRMIPELAPRISDMGRRMDMHTNVWKTQDGEQIFAGVGSRPLMIPVGIDQFGCLDTQL